MLDPASIAATALVGAMAKDSWDWVKGEVVALFRRGGDQVDIAAIGKGLEISRAEIVAADEHSAEIVAARVQGIWEARLQDLVASHSELAQDLVVLAERLEEQADTSSKASILQRAEAFDNSRQAVQGQGVQKNNFGDSKLFFLCLLTDVSRHRLLLRR